MSDKKKYVKPVLNVEKVEVNQAIADCGTQELRSGSFFVDDNPHDGQPDSDGWLLGAGNGGNGNGGKEVASGEFGLWQAPGTSGYTAVTNYRVVQGNKHGNGNNQQPYFYAVATMNS